MKPSIQLPREKIAELLQASGSTLTPEEYAASLPPPITFLKYPSRASAAAWSKNILIFVAVISIVFALFDIGLENVILAIGLGTVTYYEIRVHRYFCEDNARAPSLGFNNQSCFAAGVLIYCLYHAYTFSLADLPTEIRDLSDPDALHFVQQLFQSSFLIAGILGGVSQFWLAWYYRQARAN